MDAQVADLPGAVRTMSQAEALPVPGPAPFALVGVEYVKHVAALVCAGAVLLVGPLGCAPTPRAELPVSAGRRGAQTR